MTAMIGDQTVNRRSGNTSPIPPRASSTVAGTNRKDPGWLISTRSISTPITMNTNDRSVARDMFYPMGLSVFIIYFHKRPCITRLG
jgi:hypothetical protein